MDAKTPDIGTLLEGGYTFGQTMKQFRNHIGKTAAYEHAIVTKLFMKGTTQNMEAGNFAL